MKRRTFAEKFSVAVASLSLASSNSISAKSLDIRCTPTPPSDEVFEKILSEFEVIMWTMVELGDEEAENSLSFLSEYECKESYKKIESGIWYNEMQKNLKNGVEEYGSPFKDECRNFHHYYLNFYRCCYKAGIEAARLTIARNERKITTADFEQAMCIVHDTMKRLSRRGGLGPLLFACG